MPLFESVTAEAHCSTANLGAGFDAFGLALGKYSDRVQAKITMTREIRIITRGRLSKGLSKRADENSAGPPALELLRRAGSNRGLEIIVKKGVPPGLGLGSSGATAAACTKAIDRLLRLGLSSDELVTAASLGEAAVSGSAHTDNVAASLLGGFVVSYGSPSRVVSVKPPTNLSVVIVSPKLRIPKNKTGLARKLVPRTIEVQKAVLNAGRAAAIALGFAEGKIDLIGSGMEDAIAEPARKSLIPGYEAVKAAALAEQASGVAISGAGPSVVALVNKNEHSPERVGRVMVKAFSKRRVRSTFFVTRPAGGARILRSD